MAPWNGSAPNQTFGRTDGTRTGNTTWTQAEGAGVDILSSDHDTHDSDVAAGINASLKHDGGNTATANLPMGGFKHTGVGDATGRTQYLTGGQASDDEATYYATVGGTADAITLTSNGFLDTQYNAGQRVRFIAGGDNTTAVTLAIGAVAADAVVLNDGANTALSGGEIQSGAMIDVQFDGTNWLLMSVNSIKASQIATSAVTTTKIADNAVTLDKLDHGTQGDILYYGASGAPSRLAAGTSGQALVTAGAGANPAWGSINTLTLGTPVSASSTSVDFTGIPSWAERVTIVIASLSSNGTSNFQVQIGSGSFTTSGYTSQASSGATGSGQITSGFIGTVSTGAANSFSGSFILTHIGSNQWVSSSILAFVNVGAAVQVGGGNSGTLGGALDRVRITTIGGTDTFDAGTINIMYD